jgi:hypothetical protein
MDVIGGDGQALPAGRVGELALRRRDGWIRTGHRVSRDANGWLFFPGPGIAIGHEPISDAQEPVTLTRDSLEDETYRRSAASVGGGDGQ